VSKLFIHQTAAAELHGGLFDSLYLHDLQSLLAQKPHEQNNEQVHGGGHIHRMELAGCHADLKAAGQVISETCVHGVDIPKSIRDVRAERA